VGVHEHHDATLGSVVGGAFLFLFGGAGLEQSSSSRSGRDGIFIAFPSRYCNDI
jgi:hypothetical protein